LRTDETVGISIHEQRHQGRGVMAALGPFDVTVAATDGVVRVAVLGDLDCASAPQLRQVLDRVAEDRRDVVVDLRSTEFVDCAGIGALVVAYERRRQLGGELVLEAPSTAVRRVLQLTGLVERIPTADDPGCESTTAAG
jgi:anti-anti-sigma factor